MLFRSMAVLVMQVVGVTIVMQTVSTLAYLLITFVSTFVLIYEIRKMTDKYLLTGERWSHGELNS